MEQGRDTILEWAWEGRPLPGEVVSGDAAAVVSTGSRTLIAVADGLGHGPEAAQAAERGMAIFRASTSPDLEERLDQCHRELQRTRGAAMSVASIEATGQVGWIGVGNVEGAIWAPGRPTQRFVTRGGVVGGPARPPFRRSEATLPAGGLFAVATDGIKGDFPQHLSANEPEGLVLRLLRECATGNDDALVLVARLRSGAGGPA